jgi:hypothetical protein
MGFWSLGQLQIIPDAELETLIQKGQRPLGAIAESQSVFSFWSSVALIIVAIICLIFALIALVSSNKLSGSSF